MKNLVFAFLTVCVFFASRPLSADIVILSSGSSSGYTMTNGNTYVVSNSLTFSNGTAGGNGITIADNATVVIYIPTNVTLTAMGANGSGRTGGGAGILVPESSTLVITGEGEVVATGGNAGNGGKGANGANGVYVYGEDHWGVWLDCTSGAGGVGGAGGGGAGAAIGGNGGQGGSGGLAGNSYYESGKQINHSGLDGSSGSVGEKSCGMGTVFILGRIHADVSAGSSGRNGACGSNGRKTRYGTYGSMLTGQSAYGGGGGAGGGAGSAPLYSIGAGGSSAGGGGGGGSGGLAHDFSKIYDLTGGGGQGGKSNSHDGETGTAPGSITVTGYSGYQDSLNGTYSGGASGLGGAAGAVGEHGSLYVGTGVTLTTPRSNERAETHSAAQYPILFNPNGASLNAINPIVATLGVKMPQGPVVTRPGFLFHGWSDSPTGGTMYYDAEGNALLSCYSNAASITLYAQWENLLENPNSELVSGNDYAWQTTVDETLPGGYELYSATIPDGTNSWMKTMVTRPGKLSFDWKVSCENRYAYLQVLIDGVQKKRITGEKDWASLLYEIEAGEHEIVWNYVKDGASAVGEDAGFVRNISWRPYLAFSSETAHGSALPADNNALLYGDNINASVDASITDGNVRYDCIGWLGTGSVPEAGTSNECAFVLKEISTLSWLWQTNYWTTLSVEGPATADFAEDWLAADSVRTVALAPTVPYYAIAVAGDTGGVSLDGTNIVFQADRPRAIAVSVRELTIPGVLGTTNLSWRTGGDAVWFPEAVESADGLGAAQSGALDAKGTSWLETTVIGPGTMSFQWKFAPGSVNSGIDLLIDGDYEDGLTDATDGWESYSLDIGSGRHLVRWEFYGSAGDNGAALLNMVSWDGAAPTATSTTPDPVPYIWLDSNAKPFVTRFYGDYEAAANATARNGRKVWECYVAGLDPTDETDDFIATIEMVNGVPQISVGGRGERPGRVYTVEGKKNLDDSWGPTNATSRFFHIKARVGE